MEINEGNAGRLANSTYNTACRPIRSTSLFYSLYYLTEIEGDDRAAYDLSRITNELHEGFYLYGLLTSFRESVNSGAMLFYEGYALADLTNEEKLEFLGRHVAPQYKEDLFKLMTNRHKAGGGIVDSVRDVMTYMARIERHFHGISEDERWIDNLEQFFSIGRNDLNMQAMVGAHETGWADIFGGDGWANVCSHLKRRKEYPKTMWVDQSFAIEHNAGNWFGKFNYDSQDRQNCIDTLTKEEVQQTIGHKITSKEELMVGEVHQWLMDQNHDENMGPLFRLAANYSDEIEFDMARYARMNYNA